jgi:hypothetical protein
MVWCDVEWCGVVWFGLVLFYSWQEPPACATLQTQKSKWRIESLALDTGQKLTSNCVPLPGAKGKCESEEARHTSL